MTSHAWSFRPSDSRVASLNSFLAPHGLWLAHNHEMHPRELANSICDALQQNGHQAFLVGGCVRDLLLGREPADYDVATTASPNRVMRLFPDSLAIGAHFGVVLVTHKDCKVEVATFRRDMNYSD